MDILFNKVYYLPDTLMPYWWLNNNGLMCICYAAHLTKTKNLYLFGFNFYHDNYLNKISLMGKNYSKN